MEILKQFIEIVLHLDAHLNQWIILFGPGIYALLFLIIFCETGLVITPFLPGDSLLFALGALTAVEGAFLKLPYLMITMFTAAILGDITNYSIGRGLGQKILSMKWKFFNEKHLKKTHDFYEKHGGKTIILARYVPIVRTFAPFVAGMGKMKYLKFISNSVVGGATWIILFLLAGHYFGNLPSIKRNFHVVIVAIIFVSFLPVLIEIIKARRESKRAIG